MVTRGWAERVERIGFAVLLVAWLGLVLVLVVALVVLVTRGLP